MVFSNACSDRPDHEGQDARKKAIPIHAVFANACDERQERDEKSTCPDYCHDSGPTREGTCRSVDSPAAPSRVANPIAATRYGPADAVATALIATGSASEPSLVADATVTRAIPMPVMPTRPPPPNAAWASPGAQANRRLSTLERASNGPSEVQERYASEKNQGRTDAAPRLVVLSPGRPVLVGGRVVRRVATAQKPTEDQEYCERDAGQSEQPLPQRGGRAG